MPLVIIKRSGCPWTVRLVFQGHVLAQIASAARTEQEGDHQEREADLETLEPKERIEVEKESDGNVSSEDGYTDDMESEDDEDEDYEGEDYEDEHDEAEDDEEGGIRDLESDGEEREASSLAIVVSLQEIEITGFTIDEETWRTFHAKPIEER